MISNIIEAIVTNDKRKITVAQISKWSPDSGDRDNCWQLAIKRMSEKRRQLRWQAVEVK